MKRSSARPRRAIRIGGRRRGAGARPVLLALPGNEALGEGLADALDAEPGGLVVRRFPDGETYVRIEAALDGRPVALVCTLHHPDERLAPLLLVAATARDLGARSVGLVAPYLAYMRQDARFRPGEGITSVYVARLLAGHLDWLATVDPHLHRHDALEDVYPIPCATLHAAPLVAAWIRAHVRDAILIGPDRESAQWVGAVATHAGVPFEVLEKVRYGDDEVEVSVPHSERLRGRTPVLVDDVISTAGTMIAAIGHLRGVLDVPPLCIGVHAVFAAGAYERLLAAGASRVVTCNTIAHPSNAIDVGPLLCEGVAGMFEVARRRGRRPAS